MRKKILIIALGLFAIAIGIIVYKSASVIINNTRTTKTDESSVTDGIKEESYRYSNSSVFWRYTRYLANKWEYEEYFNDYFTDKFFRKYKNAVDIYPDIDDVFEIGRAEFGEKDDEVVLKMDWKESTSKQFHTCVVYQLVFDDDNKIDDCKIIDSYNIDIRTEQRLDRPMIIDVYDAEGYITVFLRPIYFHHGEAVTYLNEWGNIPKSTDCQIINLPQEPTKDCEVRFPYYKLTYIDEQIKCYKVEYTFNNKAQFTKIEFIEISEEEYNIKISNINRGLF